MVTATDEAVLTALLDKPDAGANGEAAGTTTAGAPPPPSVYDAPERVRLPDCE